MPAVNQRQRRLFGMVRAAQRGETPASPQVAKIAASISPVDAKKFAKTKEKNLPESAVPGKPAERLGAVTAIPEKERDAARQRLLAKTKEIRDKKKIKEELENLEEAEIEEGMSLKDFTSNRRKLKRRESSADAKKRGHVGKEWYNSGRKYSPDEAKRSRANMDDEERRTRHRSAVDPDNEDDNNYSADKTKNPKKLRKQKAMGEIKKEGYLPEAGEQGGDSQAAASNNKVNMIKRQRQNVDRRQLMLNIKKLQLQRQNVAMKTPATIDMQMQEQNLSEMPYQVYGSPDGKKTNKIGKPVKSKRYADARAAELADTHKGTGGAYHVQKESVIPFKTFIAEGGLARAMQKSKTKVTGHISADRGDDEKANRGKRKGLEKDLKKHGIGHKKGVGEYKYGSGETGREVSYQTSKPDKMSKRRFGKVMRRLGRKHGQESVITKDSSKPAKLHYTEKGSKAKSDSIGKTKAGKHPEGYGETSSTKVRSGKLPKQTKDRKFHYG
jgi:hypothetical protein